MNIDPRRPFPSAALLFAAGLAGVGLASGGCETLGLSDDDDDDDRPIASSADREGREVARGEGPQSYTARDDGTVRLYNADRGELIYEGRLARGQRFQVVPDDDAANVDGRAVYEQNLEREEEHAITFEVDRDDRDDDDDRATSNVPRGVPAGSVAVGDARGPAPMSYRADDDGTIYVYDRTARRVVATEDIDEGELFTIDLSKEDDRASVSGRALSRSLDEDGSYRVYFEGE